MKTQLFVNNDIPLKNIFIEAIDTSKVDYIELSKSIPLPESFFSVDYNRIGVVWHNTYLNISFGNKLYVNDNYNFWYFKKEFIEYLTLYNNLNVPIIVDLITCSLNNKIFVTEVNILKNIFKNITIEYSLNKTGSVINSDWIMESNNVSIKDIYFNNKIDDYPFTLGGSSLLFNAVITYDGGLYLCGGNDNGILGFGYNTDREPSFKRVINGLPRDECGKLKRVTAVSCGFFAIGLICDGDLYLTGINGGSDGTDTVSILGLNIYDQNVSIFTKVTTGLPKDQRVIDVSIGVLFQMVVTCDGSLYSCGLNTLDIGNLGLGTFVQTFISIYTKVPLPDGVKVKSVSCGLKSTLILTTDGVYVCGDNKDGKLGLGDLINRSSFVKVTTGYPQHINVIDISCGARHSGVLLCDGTFYTCGDNTFGPLGIGPNGLNPPSMDIYATFMKADSGVPSCKKVIGISCGTDYTDIILEDGSLYVCGENAFGNLGLGTAFFAPSEFSFKQVTLNLDCKKVVAINAEFFANSIILCDGTMYTCGIENAGTLGQSIESSDLPDNFVSVFSPVSFTFEQGEDPIPLICSDNKSCIDLRALSLNEWNYIMYINKNIIPCDKTIKANCSKTNVSIISNYQNYKVIIKNVNTCCEEVIMGNPLKIYLSSLKLFKPYNTYKVKIVDLFNNIIKNTFKIVT